MTIASALTALNTDIVNARTAITNKGGTVTSGGGSYQLATDIATIPTGTTPTLITKNITANGTYNASSDNADGYSSVTVNVSASKYSVTIDNMLGEPNANGVLQAPSGTFTFTLPSNITDIGAYALDYRFVNSNIYSVNLSNVTTVSGYNAMHYAFFESANLTNFDLSKLTTVSGGSALSSTFAYCRALTSINLPKLTTVSGNGAFSQAFSSCTNLVTVNLPELTTISGSNGFSQIFSSCTKLVTVNLPKLTTISGGSAMSYAFSYDSKLTDVYFNALTTTSFGSNVNQFNNMLLGTGKTTTHTIHFPSNLSSTISGLTGYPLFGGTSGYVTLSFDLPATS